MLTKRIIPCLDVDDGFVLKGINFQELRQIGIPARLAEKYNIQGADEIVFLDIGASPKQRKTLFDVVKNVSKKVFIPLTVGGGIRTIEDIQKALSNGADKVSINTAAVVNPDLIKTASERFGSQCIVCAIDAEKNKDSWYVLINGGKKITQLDAIEWAKKVEKLGAGEILLTSWNADGAKKGYDLELTKKIVESINIPVIASGGAGSLKDVFNVLTKANADAALIASLLHFEEFTVEDIKSFLKGKGVVVR